MHKGPTDVAFCRTTRDSSEVFFAVSRLRFALDKRWTSKVSAPIPPDLGRTRMKVLPLASAFPQIVHNWLGAGA